MDRSIYPEGVEVKQDDLARTESTKSFHIRQRHKDSAIFGVKSGLSVSINSGDDTLIDVALGNGYSPNGEFVELTTAQTGISLSDYTANTVNLVLAVYTETNTELEPHETNGNSFATSAVRSVRIVVLTQSEFDALPQTDNNLNNDDKDRALILARATAQGTGISLTSSNIINASTFNGAKVATNLTNTITGVTIDNVDRDSSVGSGTLSFLQSTTELTWKAPGDTSAGSAVNVSVTGSFILISNNGQTLEVIVISSALPTSNQTDTISVTDIYTQTVNGHSAEDIQHRSLLGSGTPTATNPHGLTLSDLGGGDSSVEEHQDLFHSNGIRFDSSSSLTGLAPTVDSTASPDELNIASLSAGGGFYLNGKLHTSFLSNTIVFTDIADDRHAIYDIYAVEGTGGIATLEKVERLRYNTIPAPTLSTVLQLVDLSTSAPIGTAQIQYNADDTLQFKAPGDVGFGEKVPVSSTDEELVRVFNETNEYYIDIFAEDSVTINGAITAPVTENLVITARPTENQLEGRLRIATVLFSGSATGFIGYGFGAGNSPNTLVDHRFFGLTGANDLRSDINFSSASVRIDRVSEQRPDPIPRGMFTNNWIGINERFPEAPLHITGDGNSEGLSRIVLDNFGIGNSQTVYRGASGTKALPTTPSVNSNLGRNRFYGYDGSVFLESARITGAVDDTISSGIVPGRVTVHTMDQAGNLTLALRIDSNQNVAIGNFAVTNSDIGLEVQGTRAFRVPVLTTAERDGLTAVTGMIIYNSTTDSLQVVNNGNAWGDVP